MKKIFFSIVAASFAFSLLFMQNAEAYTHTEMLRLGSQGVQVAELQRTLNQYGFIVSSSGAGSPGMESIYFGPLTRAAVIRFQASQGLAADGVVGSITGARLAALTSVALPPGCTSTSGFSALTGQPCSGASNLPVGCTSASGYSPVTGEHCLSIPLNLPTGCTSTSGYSPLTGVKCDSTSPSIGGGLSGSNGMLESVAELTQYNDEEVGENDKDTRVLGFEVDASNDGDIRLRSVRVEFDPSNNGSDSSDQIDDYIDAVTIWMGDRQIGAANVDDFSESNDIYSHTINLSSDAIVRAGDEVEFFVAVDAASNLDSGDIDSDAWNVDVESIRYEDGSGVISTFDEAPLGSMNVEIDFVDFSTAADTELRISTAPDSPDAGVVTIDEDDGEDGVVLLRGRIRLDGNSDVTLDELPITLSVTESNLNEIASQILLILDDEEYSENVPSLAAGSSTTVVFDDLDFDLAAGTTVDFEVRSDINGTDDFTEGASVTASLTSVNRLAIEAENEEGDNLNDSEISGTAIGEEQEFRSIGISLALVSTDTDVTVGSSSSDDLGTFKIRFRVTASGDTVYVSPTTANTINYTVDRAGSAVSSGISATLVNITDNDTTSTGLYEIEDGESETFELTVTVNLPTAGSAGQYRLSLTGFKWGTDSADTTPNNAYTSNLNSFRTSYQGLN